MLLSIPVLTGFFRSTFSNVRSILRVGLFAGMLLLIVHFNTYVTFDPTLEVLTLARIEHPFLRADNRHFVFYIWRRTIKRHPLAKYIAVPIYYASGWLVLTALSYSQSTLFVLGIISCTALTIVPSPLLEFRYFVLPYLFWRLHVSPVFVSKWRGILEYVWYEVINLITLWIFISRPFAWDSEPGKIQRFIW